MSTNGFFQQQRRASFVKSEIVSKYFAAWSKIMVNTLIKYKSGDKVLYMELFCGPGVYDDGADSTPMKVLRYAANDQQVRNYLDTIFVDKNKIYIDMLNNSVKTIKNIQLLKYTPFIACDNVDEDLTKAFSKIHIVPTFMFADPWGYKGLTRELIKSVVKDWGCDCIFFFSYGIINRSVSNPCMIDNMKLLFGEDIYFELKNKIEGKSPVVRERLILDAVRSTYESVVGKYVLVFTFYKGIRVSHHLVFLTKHIKGYNVMKDIMSKESINNQGIGYNQGVPTFKFIDPNSLSLFELDDPNPLNTLKTKIMEFYADNEIRMSDVYNGHHVGTNYIKRNYKRALLELEEEGMIITTPPSEQRRKNTFADSVVIRFP